MLDLAAASPALATQEALEPFEVAVAPAVAPHAMERVPGLQLFDLHLEVAVGRFLDHNANEEDPGGVAMDLCLELQLEVVCVAQHDA